MRAVVAAWSCRNGVAQVIQTYACALRESRRLGLVTLHSRATFGTNPAWCRSRAVYNPGSFVQRSVNVVTMTGTVSAAEGWDGACRLSHRVQTAASVMYIVAEEAEANRGGEASFLVDTLLAWVAALKGCDPMRWVEQAGQAHGSRRGAVAAAGGACRVWRSVAILARQQLRFWRASVWLLTVRVLTPVCVVCRSGPRCRAICGTVLGIDHKGAPDQRTHSSLGLHPV